MFLLPGLGRESSFPVPFRRREASRNPVTRFFQVLEAILRVRADRGEKLGIFLSSRAYTKEGRPPNFFKSQSQYSFIFSTYFFIILHIFHIFLYYPSYFSHIPSYFSHSSCSFIFSHFPHIFSDFPQLPRRGERGYAVSRFALLPGPKFFPSPIFHTYPG